MENMAGLLNSRKTRLQNAKWDILKNQAMIAAIFPTLEYLKDSENKVMYLKKTITMLKAKLPSIQNTVLLPPLQDKRDYLPRVPGTC